MPACVSFHHWQHGSWELVSGWLIAGILSGSVIPFTLIVILPTYKRLLSPVLDKWSAANG